MMWYMASKFKNEYEARSAYIPVKNWLHGVTGASVLTIQVKGIWHLVVVGTDDHNAKTIEEMYQFLSKGTITSLPRNVLDAIAIRRDIRVQKAYQKGETWNDTFDPVIYDSLPTNIDSGIRYVNLGELYQDAQKIQPIQFSPEYLTSLRNKPFIIAYQDVCERAYKHELEELLKTRGMSSLTQNKLAPTVIDYINGINNLRLKRAKKYLFTPSAIDLHTSVLHRHVDNVSTTKPNYHMWIECFEEQKTPYGNMRSMFFCNAFPVDEINILVSAHPHDTERKEYLYSTYGAYKNRWELEIINDQYDTLFDFTYDLDRNEWVFLPSHKCPVKQCVYPQAENLKTVLEYEAMAVCKPCEYCIAACKQFATWLVTALAMIDGEYSITPDEPQFQELKQEYVTTVVKTVGKGKNKRRIKQTAMRETEYTLVSYDVTQAKHRELTIEEMQELDTAHRTNWLATTPSGNIIWIKKVLKPYQRRYPKRKDGTRKDGAVAIKQPFIKRVPMLKVPHKTVITKVTASKHAPSE